MSKGWAFVLVIVALVVGFLGAHAMFWWGPAIHGWGNTGWGPGMMARWGGPGAGRGFDDGAGYGPWMMGRGGFGPGMMGYEGGRGYGRGYGPGMMWGRDAAEGEDLNLTVDQVKRQFERRLAIMGNDRVKLGPIVEKDANTITVDIVTTDKEGLVQRFSVDRKRGIMRWIDG